MYLSGLLNYLYVVSPSIVRLSISNYSDLPKAVSPFSWIDLLKINLATVWFWTTIGGLFQQKSSYYRKANDHECEYYIVISY